MKRHVLARDPPKFGHCGAVPFVGSDGGGERPVATEQENAVLAGLMFLIMTFNWEGYLVPQNRDEFVYLGDEHIVFSSADAGKMKDVEGFVSTFHLEVINDIREAWK